MLRARDLVPACVAGLLAVAAVAKTSDRPELPDARRAMRGVRSYESYLRRLAAADPEYRWRDPTTANEAPVGAPLRAVYDGLEVLLSDSLKAEFLGLSSDALRHEFVRRYWVLRDPTPTTPQNEREEEHERRVHYARRFVCRPLAGKAHRNCPGLRRDRTSHT